MGSTVNVERIAYYTNLILALVEHGKLNSVKALTLLAGKEKRKWHKI